MRGAADNSCALPRKLSDSTTQRRSNALIDNASWDSAGRIVNNALLTVGESPIGLR